MLQAYQRRRRGGRPINRGRGRRYLLYCGYCRLTYMRMDSRWLGVIVFIIIVALGGWYILSNPSTGQAPSGEPAVTEEVPAETPPAATVPAPATLTYTDTGFSPASVTVTEGQTVTWVNQSSKQMWVASARHPDHT